MKQRAIQDLSQLSESALFREISTGISLVTSNALGIEKEAMRLYDSKSNAYDILMAVAREEAAKALILFDTARCPPKTEDFQRQIRRFNDHLAKGIYANVCDLRVASKAELCSYINREREEFYLDGPNDVDWIFPNRILHSRERNMYVDYVRAEDSNFWLDPFKRDRMFSHNMPDVVSLASALLTTGCTTPEALAKIAEIWRPLSLNDSCTFQQLRKHHIETLLELEELQLIENPEERSVRTIVELLPFPLHDIDLKMINVKTSSLEEIQQNYSGEWV